MTQMWWLFCLESFITCQEVNIWVTFGFGKNYTHYHVNAICEDLGKEKVAFCRCWKSSKVCRLLFMTSCRQTLELYGKWRGVG